MASYISDLFGKLLSITNDGSIIGITNQAIANYKNLKENTNFADLENFLNQLYYGEETAVIDGKQVAEEVQTKFADLQSNIMAEILGSAAADEQAQTTKQYKIGQQNYINKGVYTTYLNMLQDLLDNWNTGGKEEIKLRNLKNGITADYNALYRKIERMITDLTEVSVLEMHRKTRAGNRSKYTKIFEQIAELENLGVYLTKLQYIQGKIGDSQERLLSLAKDVGNSFTEKQTKNLLDTLNGISDYSNLQKKVTTAGLDRVHDIELSSDLIWDKNYEVKNKKGNIGRYNFDGVKVSVSAIRGFQQKMDVEFDVPGYQGLRVSMKSWNGFTGHDLGKTSLLNALLRTANIDSTLAFGLQLKYHSEYKHSSNIISLHKWAKTIAIMDIAAGIGQGEGYANTLIIQDRKNKCFRIFDMKSILSQALSEQGYFRLAGYDEDAVSNMDFSTKSRLGNQRWRNAIMSALQAQKISITTKVT